jgi:RimJ/RimL family protein N-acetyltransferase
MLKKLRFKYVNKKCFIWQDLEFLRTVRSNSMICEMLFEDKKITRVEQEYWFNNIYCNEYDYHIWIIYHEQNKCAIGYVSIEIENIKHRRLKFNYIISPEFNYIRCDKSIINWIINKSKIIELDIHKVWCYVLENNDKRIEMLYKYGFEVDGFIRDYVYKNGKYLGVSIVSKLIS